MLRLLAVACLALCASCVSTPRPIYLTTPPPSEAMEQPNGKAEIVVTRPGQFFGWGNSFGIFINDLHVGELGNDTFVHHYVEPGTVQMFAGAEARSPAQFPVEADRVYYFHTVPKQGWWFARVQLEISTPDVGSANRATFTDNTFPEPRPFPFELDLGDAKADEPTP